MLQAFFLEREFACPSLLTALAGWCHVWFLACRLANLVIYFFAGLTRFVSARSLIWLVWQLPNHLSQKYAWVVHLMCLPHYAAQSQHYVSLEYGVCQSCYGHVYACLPSCSAQLHYVSLKCTDSQSLPRGCALAWDYAIKARCGGCVCCYLWDYQSLPRWYAGTQGYVMLTHTLK